MLQTLEFPVLAKEWRSQPEQADVVAAGVSVWRKRINRLSELLRQGTVTAEVRIHRLWHKSPWAALTVASCTIAGFRPGQCHWPVARW
jgi:hypothetical protein